MNDFTPKQILELPMTDNDVDVTCVKRNLTLKRLDLV